MFFKFGRVFALITLFLSAALGGCSADRSALDEKLLEHDPSFKKMLDERDLLEKKLFLEKNSYLREKEKIDGEISALNEEKLRVKSEYIADVEKLRQQLDPAKQDLLNNLVDLKDNYALKKEEVAGIEHDIKEISALINKKDALSLTQEEMRTWDTRLSALVEKKEKTVLEKNKLREEIEMTKLKIKVLKIKE